VVPARRRQGLRGHLGPFKLALITRITGSRTAHLVTGAPTAIWPTVFCADIFNGGTFEPEALCLRRFPRGRRRTAWDYLLEGGYDRHPDRVPARMATTPVTDQFSCGVRGSVGNYGPSASKPASKPPTSRFPGGWPNGLRPADAHHPP
jgi:hypothetical protein